MFAQPKWLNGNWWELSWFSTKNLLNKTKVVFSHYNVLVSCNLLVISHSLKLYLRHVEYIWTTSGCSSSMILKTAVSIRVGMWLYVSERFRLFVELLIFVLDPPGFTWRVKLKEITSLQYLSNTLIACQIHWSLIQWHLAFIWID